MKYPSHKNHLRYIACTMLIGMAGCLVLSAQAQEHKPQMPLTFLLRFDSELQRQPFTGRAYVIVSAEGLMEPRRVMRNWFAPPNLFVVDVTDVAPDEPIQILQDSRFYPNPMSQLAKGTYHVQAVARRSLDHPVPGFGVGDLYSDAETVEIDAQATGTVELVLSHEVKNRQGSETDRIKFFEMQSPSLSKFHGRPITMRAGVILPRNWSESLKSRFPVLYFVTGFGGDHSMARWLLRSMAPESPSQDMLIVVPDATCYRGHSVFADSANNGPWGHAFVHELAPTLEKQFRGTGMGEHRYVTGVSSGGWSSLWLQISYPDQFDGCWAHAPDPVDFRSFQQINLYRPGENMFRDGKGERRPLAREGDRVLLYYDDFVRLEETMGPGGQIGSFEAVFSDRAGDRNPYQLFDRNTGAISAKIAKSWEAYDIRLLIERNWDRLKDKLSGKLHIYAGKRDTFYLDRAVELLKDSLEKLGSDAVVIVDPDMGHSFYRPAMKDMHERITKNFRSFTQE